MYQIAKRKLNNSKGMTMVELLAVVAILIILTGVAFVAVTSHQRTLGQLERDGIAKEIFIAAQNHLTAAKGENNLQEEGNSEASETAYTEIVGTMDIGETPANQQEQPRYIVVNHGTVREGKGEAMWKQMLPFGSLDETIRLGGNYVIRYQPRSGKVLDVFYCSQNGSPSRFNHAFFSPEEGQESETSFSDLTGKAGTGEQAKDARRDYMNGSILGWYGGEDLEQLGERLKAPKLKVVNGNRLYVKVWDPNNSMDVNTGISCRLFVEGKTSGAKAYCYVARVSGENQADMIVLDDVTKQNTVANSGNVADASGPKEFHFKAQFSSLSGSSTDPNMSVSTNTLDDDEKAITFKEKGFIDSSNTDSADKVKQFIPGEDLKIYATVFSTKMLANIAQSSIKEENSLFADITKSRQVGTALGSAEEMSDSSYKINGKSIKIVKDGDNSGKGDSNASSNQSVYISNIRHLENLDTNVSGFDYAETDLKVVEAIQTGNLDWSDYASDMKVEPTSGDGYGERSVYYGANVDYNSKCKRYKPVDISRVYFVYQGLGFSVKNLKVEDSGPAGMFGSLSGCDIRNIKLINPSIKSLEGTAGALAGSMTNTAVTNVVARVVAPQNANLETAIDNHTISGTTDVGGLAGSIEGGTVRYSAASLVVEGGANANAGGLIGRADATSGADSQRPSVIGSYAGGHTAKGSHLGWVKSHDSGDDGWKNTHPYDVVGDTAGGLIGSVGSAAISGSYSTCSVDGSNASGGFVGTMNSGSLKNCYTAGLVKTDSVVKDEQDSKRGAFARSIGNSVSKDNCKYLSILNEVKIKSNADDTDESDDTFGRYLGAVGDSDEDPGGITPIDKDTTSYEGFVGAPADWTAADPYDSQLETYYNKKKDGSNDTIALYPLQSVREMDEKKEANAPDGTNMPAWSDIFATKHYGDWPAPEVFIINSN